MPQFERYFGIDYSGAQTPTRSLPGLRLYAATRSQPPIEVLPPPSPRKYWTRRGMAEWLAKELRHAPPTLVGIDHGFSFPSQYFETHQLPQDWPHFLDDFCHHWPADLDHMCIDFIRNGTSGQGAERSGNPRWRRLTELRCRAKSVFHFDVQGSVAKSTHAGLPWLRFLRNELGDRIHFWPFDGWTAPAHRSVIAEAYPSLWSRNFPMENRNSHQHDAYSTARWMQQCDAEDSLSSHFHPQLRPEEKNVAPFEGWILGVA